MNDVVTQLVTLVGGAAGANARKRSRQTSGEKQIERSFGPSDETFHAIAGASKQGWKRSSVTAKSTSEKAIPLDDADFGDFNS